MATVDAPFPIGATSSRSVMPAVTLEPSGHAWLALAAGNELQGLERAGIVLERTVAGAAFAQRLRELRPRLALLVAPPAGTAEVLIAIRERRQRATLRIVFLNDISGVDARLEALALGFDDALPSTTDPLELIGRIRLMLGGGRTALVEPRTSTIAPGIELDTAGRRVIRDGLDIHLRPKEFALLALLASDPGRVFTRDELVDLAWGPRYRGNVRTVDVHVRWLRAKLERNPTNPRHVVTVRGLGYRLDPAER